MKIILATPIFPPDIGGPAQYVKNLAEGLSKKGFEAEIFSYQKLKNIPQPFRFFVYLTRVFKKAKDCDIIFAFNLVSCGIPAYLAAKIRRKKFLIRIGGDFLWERAIEQGRTKKPLREYYQESKTLKEKFWLKLIKIVLNGVDRIVFTGNFQKEIYQKQFSFKKENVVIIPNPFPQTGTINNQLSVIKYQILYAGRLIKLKNLDILLEAFNKVLAQSNKNLTLKIIGQGPEEKSLKIQSAKLKIKDRVIFEKPISHQNLLKEIQKSYLCVLPSLTEISPNFALECLALRKPILLTKETGYYEIFKENIIFIEPKNENDLSRKIIALLDDGNYKDYVRKIEAISTSYSWHEIIEKYIKLF
jgi:glycosyltransferase involved in cell wall biosynthesis